MEERPEKSDPQQPSLSSRGGMAAFPDRQADPPFSSYRGETEVPRGWGEVTFSRPYNL